MKQTWSVRVELLAADTPDSVVEQMNDLLWDLHPDYPAIGYAENGNVSARISVDANTARQAFDLALKTVTRTAREAGCPTTVASAELDTAEELERHNNTPLFPELAGVSEVADICGVTKQRASQLVELPSFPPAVAKLKAGPVFVAWQVKNFAKRWEPKKPGRPRKTSAA